RTILFALFMLTWAAFRQPPVAPTPDQVGNPRGDNFENYNILQSFELGYRWRSLRGDRAMYRSPVNYGDGLRLLSSSLYVQPRNRHGRVCSELTLASQGLGSQPCQCARRVFEKNRMYRYDLMWRSTDYFNRGLTVSGGEHFIDPTRHMQDHDLPRFPQSN